MKKEKKPRPPKNMDTRFFFRVSEDQANFLRSYGKDGKGNPDMSKGIRAMIDAAMKYHEQIARRRVWIEDLQSRIRRFESDIAKLEIEQARAMKEAMSNPDSVAEIVVQIHQPSAGPSVPKPPITPNPPKPPRKPDPPAIQPFDIE